MTSERRIAPVILSGGGGTRLWPLSTAALPKQLLPLTAEQTMLQLTALRTRDAARFTAPLIIANRAHADAIEAQMAEIGCAPHALILEPIGRNTAPAIALAACVVAEDTPLLVMPSDHVIGDAEAFHQAIDAALPFARDGWLVTFGIAPSAPETGYGYIRMGEALGGTVRRVDKFVEKPKFAAAEAMLAEGGHAWNGGIFLFTAGAYLDALRAHAPDMLDSVRAAMAGADTAGVRITPDAALFSASPSDSIDYAVMEKADRVAVVPVAMGWSDVGSWDALHALGPLDASGTLTSGDVAAIDVQDCLIRGEGLRISAIGVSDLIIVATRDQVIVLPRGRSQEVKQLHALAMERERAA